MDCLFCKISKNEIPAHFIYRDDKVVAFNDLHPQAPHHVLIVPNKHIRTVNELEVEDTELVGYMMQIAKKLAKELGIATEGYRLVINCNSGAGQTIFHLHLHLLGGRQLTWPPG